MACEYLDTEYVAAEPSNILSTRFFIADSFGDFGEEDFMVTDPRGSSIIIESILANNVPGILKPFIFYTKANLFKKCSVRINTLVRKTSNTA